MPKMANVVAAEAEPVDAFAEQLRSRLRDQIVAEVRSELESEIRAEMQAARARPKEDDPMRANRRRLELELAQTEMALADLDREIHRMLEDPGAELTHIMRKNARRVELQAYHKGLNFQAGLLDAPASQV